MLRTFFTAVMFLTRVPVCHLADHDPKFLARSTLFWPLLGALLGLVAGLVLWGCDSLGFPPFFGAFAALATTAILTGCFHEDAFADLCDGFGGYTPAKRLEIMRDSRVGSFGVFGAIFLVGLMASLLVEMRPIYALGALVAAHSLGRWSSVLLVWRQSYVADSASLAKPFAANVSARVFGASCVFQAVVLLGLLTILPPMILFLPALVVLVCVLAAQFFKGFLGGISGDALGATNMVCQLVVLAAIFLILRQV